MIDSDHQSERVTREPPGLTSGPEPDSWWSRYEAMLADSGIPDVSRNVIEADSRYILERGILGAGAPGDARWPDGRIRSGIVMGAVQSGKTASMLGVAAMGLDQGVDMVIILGGTRISLWRQSIERVVQQLDRSHLAPAGDPARHRVLLPDPVAAMSDDPGQSPARLYALSRPQLRRAIALRRPVVAVVLKNVHHLRAMAKVIRERLVPALDGASRPFHLLVLDDEADDGSILDASVEQRLDPSLQNLKQIPRAIVDLWERRPHDGSTTAPTLFTSYIGYTATPQANFLQSDHNPLAPTDFAIALRTPAGRGELAPRETGYREPSGLDAHYTGGEAYYHRPVDAPLCRPTTDDPMADLEDSLRGFLLAGAIRLWRREGRLLPSEARGVRFASRAEARRQSPNPHSMLFHPSAAIADHFAAAAAILQTGCGLDGPTSQARILAGERGLLTGSTPSNIAADEGPWLRWLASYRETGAAIERAFDLAQPRCLPDAIDWPELKRLVLEEVVPATRIKIVNSDPSADDRPHFEPSGNDADGWFAPPDLSTIFVSGNVMSRGLTLEGLTTTLFLRTSEDPFADTQMQMQRWFGYRGSYLELCRVVLPREQLDLFRAYHDADEALRRTVLGAMNTSTDSAPTPIVLQGLDFSATGKLTNVSTAPLCPGATPFIKHVNDGNALDPNAELVRDVFVARPSHDLVVRETLRGRILKSPLSLVEAAAVLDGLRYLRHRPSLDGWEGSRWRDLESKVGIDLQSDPDGLLPFFRPPTFSDEDSTPYVQGGPYAISAYLRLWEACLTRHARGLVGTNDPIVPWSRSDLQEKQRQRPAFYIGIRYGSGSPVATSPLADLPFPIRMMKRSVSGGQLEASWGTRNPMSGANQYLGDALFDYHQHHAVPPVAQQGKPLWRPAGAPGLILFHVIEQEGRAFPTVAVGVAIPLGGPDQFAARPSTVL